MKKSQIIGYVRVSTEDQNPERQLHGIDVDKLYTDKVSGKDIKRPQLQALLGYIREGDCLIVHSMDRLARNLDDLRALVWKLTASGITVKFIKENLIFTGDDSSMSKLLLSILGSVAEFERAHIKERQLEGIRLAKLKKLYKGRQAKLSVQQVALLYEDFKLDQRKTTLAKKYNICRATLYKHFNNYKLQRVTDEGKFDD